MRILSYLLFSIALISFSSCSSDDDNNPAQEGTLLGTWNASEFKMDGNMQMDGNNISFDGIANNLAGNDITFNSDNTLTGNSASFDMELTYVINGMPVTITQNMSSMMAHAGTWRKDGNFLYIQETGSNNDQEFLIEAQTNSTLKISANQDNIDLGSDFPPGATFSVTITYVR